MIIELRLWPDDNRQINHLAAARGFGEGQALAGYAESYRTIGRQLARYAQRVLLGAAPGDLPIEQLDQFHFVINLKTAKAIGLTIPPSLLLRADQVIE